MEEIGSIIQTHFLPLFEGIEAWKSMIAKDLLEAEKILRTHVLIVLGPVNTNAGPR